MVKKECENQLPYNILLYTSFFSCIYTNLPVVMPSI